MVMQPDTSTISFKIHYKPFECIVNNKFFYYIENVEFCADKKHLLAVLLLTPKKNVAES